MIYIIYISIVISTILFLFNKTDVFEEYVSFIPFDLFKVKEKRNMKYTEHYLDYLIEYYNNFFTRLISCPKCLGFWLCLGGSVYIGNIVMWPILYYFSILLYFVLSKLDN